MQNSTKAPIDAHTQVVGVLGYPVRHSLSPRMHNTAFAHLQLNWVYLAFEVPPNLLEDALWGMRALQIRGLNLTIPHKEPACALVDRLTAQAQSIGAVNTLFWEDRHLVGDNTDAEGFWRALQEEGIDPKGARVLVLGAGGSARAVVYRLTQGGATVVLTARTRTRAHALAQAYPIEALLEWTPHAIESILPTVDGVVNCTPLGMHPHSDTMPPVALTHLPDHAWVCDLVYRPVETRLLQEARQRGLKTVSGIGMLVWQGALAFERWTGLSAPVSVMKQALMDS